LEVKHRPAALNQERAKTAANKGRFAIFQVNGTTYLQGVACSWLLVNVVLRLIHSGTTFPADGLTHENADLMRLER